MSKYCIQFNSASIEKSDAIVPQTILVRINDLRIQGYEVIIYILNQVDDDIYHAIEFFGNVKLSMRLFNVHVFIVLCQIVNHDKWILNK
jgi:hypothetical protein